MCNYYKPIKHIVVDSKSIKNYLLDAQNYYAHTPNLNKHNSKPELLDAHTELVLLYLKKLVTMHGLDLVIDNLINNLLAESNLLGDKDVGNFIKTLFVNTIVFHDFGKINENFQANSLKMNNPFFKGKEIENSPIGTNHSLLGAFIFVCKHLDEVENLFPKNQQGFVITSILVFSYPIFKHHSRQLNDDCTNEICFGNGFEIGFLKKYLDDFQLKVNPNLLKRLTDIQGIFNNPFFKKHINSFSLFSLLKLNYSLLTASDYLATNEYMSGFPIDDLGVLSKKRIDDIYKFVSQNEWMDEHAKRKNYNKDTYQNLNECTSNKPTEENGKNLNILRQQMAIELIKNVRKNHHNNLFYIEAPTGGGKTNLSLLAAVELLKQYEGKINKVFYVFPFTTLITQTYNTISETLGLSNSEIVELHSKASLKVKESEDDEYGTDKKNYIDNLFVNFPFCLLTHIKFFDLLKTNEKEPNYMLHRLANSIIVIDELQSYNPKHWDKIIYFIKKYAETYNIKFILMSATLPKLDRLNIIRGQTSDFIYLLPNAKTDYFLNPNFCNRVNFNFDLLKKKNISLSEIADLLFTESEKFSYLDFGENKPSGSVYVIIEFIFKKTASEFYQIIQENNSFFDEVFLLSGTILEHRRKKIINFLKNNNNREKKILLITTQVVEAGVDIDMDLGFKDTSLIDSDEQLAGRINRNVNKKDCKLFLFNYNKEELIYGQDKRLEITKRKISQEQYQHILNTKDFDLLYDLVLDERNEWNFKDMAVGFSEYEQKVKSLRFKSINQDFQLIEQKNITCFIPLNVPISVNGAVDGLCESIFTDNDLMFLKQYNITPTVNNEIEGEKVFDLYTNFVNNKIEFVAQRIKEKTLQGIMSKYTFSLFASLQIEQRIICFSDEEKSKYGFKYISNWQDFYDVNFGMNDILFNGNETQFL